MNSTTFLNAGPEIAAAGVATARSARFEATRWFLVGCAAMVFLELPCWGAGVELRPGTVVEFASLEEGRRILAGRDIQGFSQFDRCVRMRTSNAVTQLEFLAFMTNQVVAWSASEITKVTGALSWVGTQTRDLNLALPSRFCLAGNS